jgi:5'-nucleotidase
MKRLNILVSLSLGLILVLAASAASAPQTFPAPHTGPAITKAVELQILNISDWHAQLDPIAVGGVNVGGAAQLSTYFKADRAAVPRTLTITAGDAYGAAPPLSALFNEEPAVKAMNLMGFDVDTFGNHNFDRGIAHLQQMIDLAEFPYVAANLKNRDANLSGVADWQIFDVGGVKVGVAGFVNEEAPNLVFPGNFGTIEVMNAIAAAKKARTAMRKAGALFYIAITHKGVTGFHPDGSPMGPLIDFAKGVEGYDLIIGDHTDVQWAGVIGDALVQENRSKGVTYSKTKFLVDPRTGKTFRRSIEFVTPVSSAVTPDPAIVAMLAPYRVALAAAFDEPIGIATNEFVRGGNIERRQEVPIGNLVSDSMRLTYGTQLALTNGGGIRAPLPSSYAPQDLTLRRTTPGYAPGPPYDLVIGDVFAVLPFGNMVVTRMITGEVLWQALENGVSRVNADGTAVDGRFPQISGFRFTYDSRLPAGSRVLSVQLTDGTPIPRDGTMYTFATNDFVASGGDGYSMLAGGHGDMRDVMANTLLDYIRGLGTIAPTTEGRITNLATAP